MSDLRTVFLVDKLQDAAASGDPRRLALVREIIKRIKLAQLEHVAVATDEVVIGVLEDLVKDRQREREVLDGFLDEARRIAVQSDPDGA